MQNSALSLAALPSVVIDRAAMASAVETVDLVVATRTTYPILTNLRLRGDGNILFVTGTDLDLTIDVAVPGAADSTFDMCLPANLVKQLLKGAPKSADVLAIMGANIVPEQKPNGVTDMVFDRPAELDFDGARYKLNATMPDSWPTLKGPATESPTYRRFTLPGADLFAALDSVAFAISNEETRYYLNGVYMHPVTDPGRNMPELRIVATDGHRLARFDLVSPDAAIGMAGAILPKALIWLLLKLLKPAKGKQLPTVDIEVTDKVIRLMFGAVTVTAKLIEGTYPDYERVTPKHNDKLATVDVAAMLEALKAVTVLASERGGKGVKLTFGKDSVTLFVSGPDIGDAEMTIPAVVEFADGLEIGYNGRYLADVLKEARSERVTLAMADAGAPTVIRGDREEWLSVLMPMRV